MGVESWLTEVYCVIQTTLIGTQYKYWLPSDSIQEVQVLNMCLSSYNKTETSMQVWIGRTF